jgi:dienelactone hydrolase
VLKTDDLPTLTRMKITYVSEAGDQVPAYLLKPKHIKGKTPGVLCLHQTTSLGPAEPAGVAGNPDLYYALELAERGYVTVASACPGCGEYDFGGYGVDPYQLGYVSGAMKAVWNHMRAVDLLQSLPEVAADRIGCIGHSQGGHSTLFVSAFDTRIRVMVTSCGFTSFEKYYGGKIRPWSQRCMMPRVATRYENDPSRMPFDFPEVLCALVPRPLFINAPLHDANYDVSGVRDCVRMDRDIYTTVFHAGNRIVAVHPDAQHSFPLAVRTQAYHFIDKWLRQAVPV